MEKEMSTTKNKRTRNWREDLKYEPHKEEPPKSLADLEEIMSKYAENHRKKFLADIDPDRLEYEEEYPEFEKMFFDTDDE